MFIVNVYACKLANAQKVERVTCLRPPHRTMCTRPATTRYHRRVRFSSHCTTSQTASCLHL